MKYCKNCTMPNTRPDIVFDENGVCDACHSAKKKDQIDWKQREDEFRELVEWAKSETYRSGGSYDCITAVSGGKDSTYIVLKCIEYGLKPLCVSFEPTLMTPTGQKNLENLSRYADVIQFKKNSTIYKELGKIGFEKLGDHDWPNHLGIFTVPIKFACQFNVPLIFYGENSQLEYGGPNEEIRNTYSIDRRWLEEFGGLLGMRTSDLLDMGYSREALDLYFYPSDQELEAKRIKGVFLGYFFRWNVRKQLEYILPYGFNVLDKPVEGSYWHFENLDCALVGIHDMLKFRKFAFGRATDQTSLDIRNSNMPREIGVSIVKERDGKYSNELIDKFCAHFDITRSSFDSIVYSFTNKDLFVTNADGSLAIEDMNRPLKKYQIE